MEHFPIYCAKGHCTNIHNKGTKLGHTTDKIELLKHLFVSTYTEEVEEGEK